MIVLSKVQEIDIDGINNESQTPSKESIISSNLASK